MELYTEVGEGVGFKYLKPPFKDVKIISEMIFGSAAVAYQSSNMKLHQLENEKQIMWSSVVQAPRITRGVKASDQSLGSSFEYSYNSEDVVLQNGNPIQQYHIFRVVTVFYPRCVRSPNVPRRRPAACPQHLWFRFWLLLFLCCQLQSHFLPQLSNCGF